MKIVDILQNQKPSLSFEVFPPKTSDKFDTVLKAATEIADINPSYMSVTYGAGGGTSIYTAEVCKMLKAKGVTPLAHLTCLSSSKEKIYQELTTLKEFGVENILALRGDVPQNFSGNFQYQHASDLMNDILAFGGFCIGGACYPEGHPESKNLEKDIDGIKKKVDSGCQFLTTQMFFDNNIFYDFLDRLCKAKINIPVIAGIMPVTNAKQITRLLSISSSVLPPRFARIVEKYGDTPLAMAQAGIAFATEQIVDIYASGINAVHVYSMNKPDVARTILNNVSQIVK